MEKPIKKTSIGGQALIEGILMRGPEKTVIACRTPQGIVLKEEDTPSKNKKAWQKLPLIRGLVGLYESMKMGMDALMYSAEVAEASIEEEEESWFKTHGPKGLVRFYEKHEKVIDQTVSIVISLGAALLLFFFIPTLVTSNFSKWIESTLVLNLIEGAFRIAMFLAYVMLISRMAEIKRVFGYHGAEHKSIHCYEHGEELTVANIKKYPIEHPRCGTSFLFNVMLISILVLSFFGWPNPWVRMAVRLVMLPVIAGISYEVNRWVGRSDGAIAQLISKPGMWLQGTATVREPEDDQIEVAIAALKEVIPEDGELDRW